MHIAVVEDEKKLADSVKIGLECEGHAVEVFYDGIMAYEDILAHAESYDVILLDLLLPGKSGFDVCRELREHDVTAPIMVLTARDATEDKVRALDSGADDLLTKPFAFDELLARIRALLRRPREVQPVRLMIDDVCLDPATREVTRSGKSVTLTLTEFELLFYLMRQCPKPISREDIFRHLWNFSDMAFSNVIDVHIRHLRQKIDDPYSKKNIRTVRGIGYAFVA